MVWKDFSWIFATKYSEYFDTWFKKSCFNYGLNVVKNHRYSGSKYKYYGRHMLMKHCTSKFTDWYDRQRIRVNDDNINILRQYCSEYHDYYATDFIIYELGKDG
jgi:hypothetical protein